VRRIKKMPNGQIVIVGDFSQFNSNGFMHLVKLNADLSIDGTFNISSGFDDITKTVIDVIIDDNNNIYCSGNFTSYQLNTATSLVKIDVNGNFIWGLSSCNALISSLEFNGSQTHIYVGGAFTSINGTTARRISKISTQTGLLDTSFNTVAGFNSTVNTISRQSDEKLIVGGIFINYKNLPYKGIVRLRQCQ
jgi:hypothetical protein